MATTFITRGEADEAYVKQSLIDLEEVVTFRNRFGREVDTLRYHAKKMVRRQEGEIVADPSPAYAELCELRNQYQAKFGREANLKWTASKLTNMINPEKITDSVVDDKELKKELRKQYKQKFGTAAFNGWSVEQLQEKLS